GSAKRPPGVPRLAGPRRTRRKPRHRELQSLRKPLQLWKILPRWKPHRLPSKVKTLGGGQMYSTKFAISDLRPGGCRRRTKRKGASHYISSPCGLPSEPRENCPPPVNSPLAGGLETI